MNRNSCMQRSSSYRLYLRDSAPHAILCREIQKTRSMYEARGRARPSRSILVPYLVVWAPRSVMQNLFQYWKTWKKSNITTACCYKKAHKPETIVTESRRLLFANMQQKQIKFTKLGKFFLSKCTAFLPGGVQRRRTFLFAISVDFDIDIRTFGAFPRWNYEYYEYYE